MSQGPDSPLPFGIDARRLFFDESNQKFDNTVAMSELRFMLPLLKSWMDLPSKMGLVGVQAQRMVHIVMDREPRLGVGTVDRTGRLVDRVLHSVVATSLQDVKEADDVAVDVGVRVLERVADTCVSDEIDNDARLSLRKESR